MFKTSLKALFSLMALSSWLVFTPPAGASEIAIKQGNSSEFAFNLFENTAKDNSQNILVSPFSVYQALSMVANGAGGPTRSQMSQVLGVSSGSLDGLNSRNQSLVSTLNKNDKVQMQVANAVYCDKEFSVKQSFSDLCKKMYFAEAHSCDFRDPETVKQINDWCSEKTHGKIPKIIDQLSSAEQMMLLNSIYFKGKWDTPFEAKMTVKKPFTTLSGTTETVPMMRATETLAYLGDKDFQAVAVPYAGKHQVMYIFLPAKGSDFSSFKSRFTKANWDKWMSSFGSNEVNLEMPKYTVKFSTELKEALSVMGMKSAFGRDADFSNISGAGKLCISRVTHKTYMDVNEEGTEAAAVTAVGVACAAVRVPVPPVNFHVDRPFVTALVDDDTKEILFLGSIVSP